MITVAEHTFEETLLPEKANILDLGCRGFLFTNELQRLGHNVYPVDADKLFGSYYQFAITNFNGYADLYKSNDPAATRLNKRHDYQSDSSVVTMTLQRFSDHVGVKLWDLIKIDIEGSEYEVIMSLTEPPAKQISVEFHCHTGIYGMREVKQMEDKLLSFGYYPAKHDKTQAHGMGFNYWDSLFILQE